MKCLVFSDNGDNAGEIISYFYKKMDIDVICNDSVIDYGADSVYKYSNGFSDNLSEYLLEMYNKNKYDYIIISSTNLGRQIAGIISDKLNEKCMPEIFSFEKNDKIVTKRFFYGGKTVLEEETGFKIFTISPGIFETKKIDKKSNLIEVKLNSSKYKILSEKQKSASGNDITKAKIIVSIGRGLGSKENIEKIMPLVDALHGEIAGSRPVCLDYKWLPEDKQVGLSGKKVKPDLYIALGISGQIQHLAGIRNAKTIIAINKDKNAPIFEECDYGIVGDLFSIVPELVEKLKK